jgi:aminopeptidase N
LSDKASVEWVVTAPEHYQVVANGIKTEETSLPGRRRLTQWEETAELPTKVMVIGVADFAVQYAGSAGGIPVYSWVYPEDRDAGFTTYAMAKNIIPFFITHLGPYAYKKLANVQSKTIFGGMENAGAIFYYENSVSSKTAEGLIAHEIAHQWFGNTATEKNWQHLWLSEGFATYMAHLYHEYKYGADSFNRRMAEDRNAVIAFSKKRNTPVVDTTYGANLMQLLNANSYQKGGWVLHMLRRKLGDTLFWKGIRKYYAVYGGHNAGTGDLQKVFEDVSRQNLDTFFTQWLYTPGQPDLAITWKYNGATHSITITIEQKQEHIFNFPLETGVMFWPKDLMKTIQVTGKKTVFTMNVAARPDEVIADPHVNLLFEGTVTEVR